MAKDAASRRQAAGADGSPSRASERSDVKRPRSVTCSSRTPSSTFEDARDETWHVAIEIVQPDRLEVDLDGLMDFRVASRLLTEGERAAQRFLASKTPAESAACS